MPDPGALISSPSFPKVNFGSVLLERIFAKPASSSSALNGV